MTFSTAFEKAKLKREKADALEAKKKEREDKEKKKEELKKIVEEERMKKKEEKERLKIEREKVLNILAMTYTYSLMLYTLKFLVDFQVPVLFSFTFIVVYRALINSIDLSPFCFEKFNELFKFQHMYTHTHICTHTHIFT